jgi:hypothetical protein
MRKVKEEKVEVKENKEVKKVENKRKFKIARISKDI